MIKAFADWMFGGDNSPDAANNSVDNMPDLLQPSFNEQEKYSKFKTINNEGIAIVDQYYQLQDPKSFKKNLDDLLKSTPFKDVRPEIKEGFAKILKTARKSPLMALGLLGTDPNRILMNQQDTKLSTGGIFFSGKGADLIYASDRFGSGADILMHEMTHRSIEYLKPQLSRDQQIVLDSSIPMSAGVIDSRLWERLTDTHVGVNELVTRYIVDKYGMDDSDHSVPDELNLAKAQHQVAQAAYEQYDWFRELVDTLERKAKIRIIQNEKR